MNSSQRATWLLMASTISWVGVRRFRAHSSFNWSKTSGVKYRVPGMLVTSLVISRSVLQGLVSSEHKGGK